MTETSESEVNAVDHAVPPGAAPLDGAPAPGPDAPWWKHMNRYHWFVFVVAALGWLFDCLDQQLFVLARPQAMRDLLPPGTTQNVINQYGVYATFFFLTGWATGGLFFGVLGDRWGRAKTMLVTILLYSLCTGLSSISRGFWDFVLYRFLTGLGVGGEFAVGVSLLAEVMPTRARTASLALLQMLSAVGNVTAASIFIAFGLAEAGGAKFVMSPWRVMFLIGAVPAMLALFIRRRLKEPEKWQRAKDARLAPVPARAFEPVMPGGASRAEPPPAAAPRQLGSYREMFRHPTWRKHAILGLTLAFSGVVGLWAIGFFTPDLMQRVQRPAVTKKVYAAQYDSATRAGDAATAARYQALLGRIQSGATGAPPADLRPAAEKAEPLIRGQLSIMAGVTSIMINVGAFFGMFGFGWASQKIGRKPTFAVAFVAAGVSTACVFLFLKDYRQLFWLVPIMGFCQLSLFAGYAIYFPELFPTHLRSTGTSFCYNVGRFVAAFGGLFQATLIGFFAGGAAGTLSDDALRSAGATMCVVFLIGLIALPFAPETKGQPLPEDAGFAH
jgi:MFS family permease